MKKFFITLFIVFVYFVSNAQTVEQKNFVAQAFPQYMPQYVFTNTETVVVSERDAKKYAKKNKSGYLYNDLNGTTYPGFIRTGDTLLVFKGVPYCSVGQMAFMTPIEDQKIAKQPKAPKAPKTVEQRQQDQQIVGQFIGTALNIGGQILAQKTGVNVGLGNGTGFAQSSNPTIYRGAN